MKKGTFEKEIDH